MFRHAIGAVLTILALAADAQAQGVSSIQIALPLAVPSQKGPVREEAVTVSATRTGARIEDVPTRVEVLNREEIEEKLLMTPGDIVMMLNEMGGMRVQTTSPGIGAATVRVQGMRGRYTRFFSDGLPLFGEVGGIGLLQIPPMDLGQVEVIKGVASSLYGAGAMGGIVNLLSRQPGQEIERQLLVNQSTRGATDVVGWYSTTARIGWAFTLLGGGHWQQQNDVDDDSWADLAGYSRGVFRPRAFWNNGAGSTFFATVGVTVEDREGGTVDGEVLPSSGGPYREAMTTRRLDGGFVGQTLLGGKYLLAVRGALANQHHDHQFGEYLERDSHRTMFGEVTLRSSVGKHTVVVGTAIEHDGYVPKDVPQFEFGYWVPGLFGQIDMEIRPWVSISGSARLDHHNEYGTFVSPRLSALFRSRDWTSRMSIGTGFFGPSPLTEETEAAGLTRLIIPEPLRAERGQSASVDVTRRHGHFTATVTLFGSRIQHPISVDRSVGLELRNLAEPATNLGIELLGTFRHEPFSVTATYSFVKSREVVNGISRDVALTPRHNTGLVAMWEREGAGRVGVECYFTGHQRLEENPYSTRSQSYVILGLLGERQFGRFRLFINGENLTGVRQTKWDPLIRPTRAPDGRWTVDAWSPLEGRNVNGGLRLTF
jgi:outer membrane receptor for ferrienterochelin and colicins